MTLPTSIANNHAFAMSAYSILLAEDNPINQTLLVRFLSKQGHTVKVAENGRIAVEAWAQALTQSPYDIILMDVMMPEMDGLDATRLIREREKAEGGHTPIVAITANAMDGDREICLESGMDDYLAKPVKLDQLVAKIETVIASAQAA